MPRSPYPPVPPNGSETFTSQSEISLRQAVDSSAKTGGVTPRVVLISLLLAAFLGYVVPIASHQIAGSPLGATHLPAAGIAVLLLILLVVNPSLRLVKRRNAESSWELTRQETLTVFISCLFSALVPGTGGENFFVPNVIASFYYATRENQWLEFLGPYLKPWFTPALTDGQINRPIVDGWYLASGEIPWGAWLVPLFAWCAVIAALYVMLGCLGVMLRAQWAEREALSFPLLKLPIALTQDMSPGNASSADSGFFRNRLMWIGFGVAVFVEMANGLHLYFPDVPAVPLAIDTAPYLTETPWNQIGASYHILLRVWPIVVGISYLLTSEISFSLWFFFVFTKFQLIVAYYFGFPNATLAEPVWTRGFAKNFISYQQIGAYFAYAALILWTARGHLNHILRRATGRAAALPGEKEEALSYPTAFWGFVLSLGFIVAWTSAAGVRFDVALAMWAVYLMVAIGLTRVVVEGGLLLVHSGWAPLGPLAGLFGSGAHGWITPSSAVPGSFIGGALMTELRGFLLPSFVQSFKLAHDNRIPMKPLMALIFACTGVAFLIGLWQVLRLGYVAPGGLQLDWWWAQGAGALSPINNVRDLMGGNQPPFFLNWISLGVGMLVTGGMVVARSHFPWFPLHPIGYLMCAPFAIHSMWFSIFLGWLIKTLVTRFGGNDAYRKLTLAFLGLILGEMVMVVFWLAIDYWQGRIGHILMT